LNPSLQLKDGENLSSYHMALHNVTDEIIHGEDATNNSALQMVDFTIIAAVECSEKNQSNGLIEEWNDGSSIIPQAQPEKENKARSAVSVAPPENKVGDIDNGGRSNATLRSAFVSLYLKQHKRL
jgi:hypothetical protein